MGSAYSTGRMNSFFAVGFILSLALSSGFGDETQIYACPENNVNFYKRNIHTIKDLSLDWHKCGELCQNTERCQFWTLHHCTPETIPEECPIMATNVCNLKNSDWGLEKKDGYISGTRY